MVLLQWGSNFAEKPLQLNFEFLSSSIRFWLSTEWSNVASPHFYIEKKNFDSNNLISENTKEPQDLSCPTQTHSSIQEHWVDISGRGIIPPIRTSKNIWWKTYQGFQTIFFVIEEFNCLKRKSKPSVKNCQIFMRFNTWG